MAETLGRRIAKHRAALGWTQEQLAERIGISRVGLSHLEAGLSVANERTVTLLAGVFKSEPADLVAGTDYPAAKAERLPLVVARHTHVDHELALLSADLTWCEHDFVPAGVRRAVTAEWRDRLARLVGSCHDPGERRRAEEALRRLNLGI